MFDFLKPLLEFVTGSYGLIVILPVIFLAFGLRSLNELITPRKTIVEHKKQDYRPWEDHHEGFGSSGPPELIVERIPHMDLSAKSEVVPGEIFSIKVYADTNPAHADETVDPIRIEAPEEVESFEITVWIVATDHFRLFGECLDKIIIERSKDRSTTATFYLRGMSKLACEARIDALFAYKGRACGKVSRRFTSLEIDTPPVDAASETTPDSFRFSANDKQPDFSIDIRTKLGSEKEFECRVYSPHVQNCDDLKPETWRLPDVAPVVVDAFMKEFTKKNASPLARTYSLIGAGKRLFDIAPSNFKTMLWRLIDEQKPLKTILIQTQEPIYPWELVIPHRTINEEEPKPLGVAYSVGRWLEHGHNSPRQRLPIEDSTIVAPDYSRSRTNAKPLKHALKESKLVADTFAGKSIRPATFDRLDNELSARKATLLHFICHGDQPSIVMQRIHLEKNETLSSIQVSEMKGIKAFCIDNNPIVFLNACEVGRTVPGLLGVGGFADSFIRVGAGCVVAPLWSVKDEFAHEVAKDFYRMVTEEPTTPYAEILRSVRSKAYASEGAEDTYAAYCFYGDPSAAAVIQSRQGPAL